jgi:DNA-binding transcriptional LysR family regulator
MDLRKLEIFVRVAEVGSFSRAAEQLRMAQPAVSIAVRRLEEELGLPLLARGRRGVALTAEGGRLLQGAQEILAGVEELGRSLGAMDQLLQGELVLASPAMLATYFLPDLLSAFLAMHPGLRASVSQAGTAQIEHMLLQDAVELGVISMPEGGDHPELEQVPLVDERMVLCMASDHPWARRRYIDIGALDGSPMVVYESGYFVRARLDALCAARGIVPDYRMQTNFLPLLLKLVRQGLGTTVGLQVMAREEQGVVGVPLRPETRVRLALAKRRGRLISRANQAFLDWAAFKL